MDDERARLQALRYEHQRRLQVLEQQSASYGLNVPPEVAIQIEDLRIAIASIDAQLGALAALRLPAPVPDFVGRADAIERLAQALRAANGRAAISSVRGLGGVGKTQLAYTVAQRIAADFPDGQILLGLRGAGDDPMTPNLAIQTVIRAFNRAAQLPDDLAQLKAIYASALAGKRVLILADDARDKAQVEPLLPPRGCALLITSRQHFTLPGMTSHELSALSETDAVALLLEICDRIGPSAAQLAKLCGYLPLALRVSASLLANDATLPIPHYLGQLERERLALLRDPDDANADVEASLRLSYDALDAVTRNVLCQLSVFSASFDLAAVEAVVVVAKEQPSGHLTLSSCQELLGLLYRRSLLEWDAAKERYRVHDLVRAFGAARLMDGEVVWERYARYYASVAVRARDLYLQGSHQIALGLTIFDTERAHIDTGWDWARSQAGQDTADLLLLNYANAVIYIGGLRYDSRREQVRQFEAALAAARRLKSRTHEGIALGNLGKVYADFSEYDQAITAYEQYLGIAHELGDRFGEANAFGGLAHIYADRGKTPQAIELFEAALLIFRNLEDRHAEGNVLSGLGMAYANLGQISRSITHFEQALTLLREVGDRRGEGDALGGLGNVYAHLGDLQVALECHQQHLTIARELGDRRGESNALGDMGIAYAILDEPAIALEFHQQEISIKCTIGDRCGEANALFNMSLVEYALGNNVQAILHAMSAMKIFEEIDVSYAAGVGQVLELWRTQSGA
jgi:tetratricopeptide (TPR) repeat protein